MTTLGDMPSGGGGSGRDVPIDDMVDIVENGNNNNKDLELQLATLVLYFLIGVSDAFCATTRSFTARNSKIGFEEVLFEKGKMFSLSDGDFQVRE